MAILTRGTSYKTLLALDGMLETVQIDGLYHNPAIWMLCSSCIAQKQLRYYNFVSKSALLTLVQG